MFNQGYGNVKTTLMEIQEAGENSVQPRLATPISNYASYERLAARDYAYKWWGPKHSNYNPNTNRKDAAFTSKELTSTYSFY